MDDDRLAGMECVAELKRLISSATATFISLRNTLENETLRAEGMKGIRALEHAQAILGRTVDIKLIKQEYLESGYQEDDDVTPTIIQ